MYQALAIQGQRSTRNRRGAQGFGFSGFADIPGVSTDYTLPNGHIVTLPWGWDQKSTQAKLDWIVASDLSAEDSILLETAAGIDSGALPSGTGGGVPVSNVGQVKAGDVIRVTIPVSSGLYIAQGDVIAAVVGVLPQIGLRYVNSSTPGLFGGSFMIDVQVLTPGSLDGVVNNVGSAFLNAGKVSIASPPSGAFVSHVEQTGGNVAVAPAPAPSTNAGGNPLINVNVPKTDFLSTLGLGALAGSGGILLVGGAVLLLVVLAKK